MPGYNPPTTDAWDLVKRRKQLDRDRTAEALRVGGTQPNQTSRKVQEAIEQLQDQQAQLALQQVQLEQVVLGLQEVVAAIPVTRVAQGSGSGYSPNDGWQTVATAMVSRPADKSSAAVMAQAQVSMDFDTNPAGNIASWPFLDARLVIAGSAGPEAGLITSVTNPNGDSVLGTIRGTAAFGRSFGGGGNVEVAVQVRVTGWANGAEPTSYSFQAASVTASATFTP